MVSTSLVWNMDLPIPYDGPLQTSLECLRLHKRRNAQNYRRVMERIFYETKVTPEWPVMVKVFDDHMEFYPLYGRTVPLSKLCYKDVLCVLPSRDERKVLVVAIPAQDNSGGIWIVAMRFHPFDPVKCHGEWPEPIVCPPLTCIRNEICKPIAVIPLQKPNICEPKPVVKEIISSRTEIIKKPPVVEPVDMVTCFICTPSPKKKCPKPPAVLPDCQLGNIKITEILIDRCANKPSVKSNFRPIYMVVPENMNNKNVQKYIENNPPPTVCDNEEFYVVIKEPINGKCQQEKLYIKKNANQCSENSFPKYPNSCTESDSGSDSCYLPRRKAKPTPKYCFQPMLICEPSKNRPLDIIVIAEKGCKSRIRRRSPPKCYEDHYWDSKLTTEDSCLQKAYSSCRLIPGKELKFSILPNVCAPKKKPKCQHDERQICITPLENSRRAMSELRCPMACNYICCPIMNERSKGMRLSRNGSFDLKIMPSPEYYEFSSSDESCESILMRCSRLKKKKPASRREKIQRIDIESENDFIITKEIKSDYMFLKEESRKNRQFQITIPSKQGYESDRKCCCKINNVQLEYDLFSNLNCPKSKEKDEIIISRKDIYLESDTSSTVNFEMPHEYAKTLAGMSKALNSYKKKNQSKQNKLSYFSSSSESECGKSIFSKNKRPRKHSMDMAGEVTEIDKSFNYIDYEGTSFEKLDTKEAKKSSFGAKFIANTKPKSVSISSSYQVKTPRKVQLRSIRPPSVISAKASDGHIKNVIQELELDESKMKLMTECSDSSSSDSD